MDKDNLLKQFETLPLSELVTVDGMVKELIRQKQRAEQKTLEEQIKGLAKEHGLVLDTVVWQEKNGRPKRKKHYAPKFQNPDDPAETWTGQGKRPNWLKAQLAKGRSLDEMKVAN